MGVLWMKCKVGLVRFGQLGSWRWDKRFGRLLGGKCPLSLRLGGGKH